MGCNNCEEKRTEPVSYIAFESMKATMERTVKRLWIIVLVLVILLFGSNVAWIIYESQFETVDSTEINQDVDTVDGSAFISGTGDVYYGESEANSNNNKN